MSEKTEGSLHMNRIIVITGASSGYGEAAAKAFKVNDNSDTVIITARGEERLIAAQKRTGADGYFVMDVTKTKDWEELSEFILKKYGRLDVLVNNAGGGVAIRELTEQSFDEIDRAIRLNLNGTIYGCRTFAPVMKRQNSGTIINLASVCAKHCWPAWSVYAAAKAGVLNFSKGLYVELQPYRIRVSCVIPAAAKTGFQAAAGLGETDNRLGTEDVAAAILQIVNLPERAVVEEVTVWGIDQVVNPL